MGDRLATVDTGRKVGGGAPVPLFVGSWLPIQHNVAWAEAHLRTNWHFDPSNVWLEYTNLQTDKADRTTVR